MVYTQILEYGADPVVYDRYALQVMKEPTNHCSKIDKSREFFSKMQHLKMGCVFDAGKYIMLILKCYEDYLANFKSNC